MWKFKVKPEGCRREAAHSLFTSALPPERIASEATLGRHEVPQIFSAASHSFSASIPRCGQAKSDAITPPALWSTSARAYRKGPWGHNVREPNHWRAPKCPNNVASTLLNTNYSISERPYCKFEHGGAKFVSFLGQHLTSVRF